MSALISAELLRLRSVRTPYYVVLGMVALVALNAAPALNGPPSSAAAVTDQLRGLAQLAVLLAAAYAAHNVADEFQRGSVAMTYLTHPLRARVAAAQTITYAGLAGVVVAAAVAVAVAITLPVAGAHHLATGLTAADVALLIGGATFSGAVLGAAGALAGSVTRHATLAVGAVTVLNVAEGLATRGGTATAGGIGPYLPFQLVGAATGLRDDVPVLVAMALLIAYLAAFAVTVHRWALPRDLT